MMPWEPVVAEVTHFCKSNPLITGGLLVSAGAAARSLPKRALDWAGSRLSTTIEVANDDPTYRWMQQWLDRHPDLQQARRLCASTDWDKNAGIPFAAGRDELRKGPRIVFTPAPGHHVFRYKGRFVFLTRSRKEAPGGATTSAPRETMEFRVLGKHTEDARALVYEAMNAAFSARDDVVTILQNRWGNWNKIAEKPRRALDTIVLAGNDLENIIAVIEQFRASKEIYRVLGIPWRLGLLLYGPPGGGKSTTAMAVAAHFGAELHMLDVNNCSGDELVGLLNKVPELDHVLMEDVDAAFANRESNDDKSRLSFSDLLGAIDGPLAPEGRILWMTTNHIENLDEAQFRSGRIDHKYYIGYALREQIVRYLTRHFAGAAIPVERIERFAEAVGDNRLSMADLQKYALQYRKKPDAMLAAPQDIRPSREFIEVQRAESAVGPPGSAGAPAIPSDAPPRCPGGEDEITAPHCPCHHRHFRSRRSRAAGAMVRRLSPAPALPEAINRQARPVLSPGLQRLIDRAEKRSSSPAKPTSLAPSHPVSPFKATSQAAIQASVVTEGQVASQTTLVVPEMPHPVERAGLFISPPRLGAPPHG